LADRAREVKQNAERSRRWAREQAAKELKNMREFALRSARNARNVARWFHAAGQTIKKSAIRAWNEIKKVAKKIAKAITGLIEKAKEFFNKIKEIGSKAELKDRRNVCIVSSKSGKVCAHNSEAMSYASSIVRRYCTNTFQSSSSAVNEKVIGIKLIYIYFGIIAFGTSSQPIKCSDENLQFVAFQRLGVHVSMFGKNVPIISTDSYMSVDRRKSGTSAVQDKFRFTLIDMLHMWDLSLIPDKMKSMETCNKVDMEMLDESFDFLSISMTIMAGPIPLTFSFGVSGGFSLTYSFGLCHQSQVYMLRVTPEFTAGASVSAGIGIAVFSGGISGELSTGYSLPSTVAHTECNRCSDVSLIRNPFTFQISLYFNFFTKRFEKILYGPKKFGSSSKKKHYELHG
jgi:hypothetical protein